MSLCFAAQPTFAQGALFDFLNLRLIERSEIRYREIVTDPPVVRENEALLARESAPSSPDPGLARPVSQLGLDAAGLRRIPTNFFGTESRRALPLIELTWRFLLQAECGMVFLVDERPDLPGISLLSADSLTSAGASAANG